MNVSLLKKKVNVDKDDIKHLVSARDFMKSGRINEGCIILEEFLIKYAPDWQDAAIFKKLSNYT